MALKISQLTPVAVNTLTGTEPVELGIAGDKNAPNGAFIPQGYIDGLKMIYVGPNAVTVSSGAAYIPGLGRVVRLPAAGAKTGIALGNNAWGHVYLYLNAGVPDIKIVTTAPAATYNGTARTMTGDTSSRYIGSVLTDASGNIFNFTHIGNSVQYKAGILGSPFRVLASGAATTPTAISLSALIPATSAFALLSTTNSDTAVAVVFGTSDQGYTLDANNFSSLLNPNSAVVGQYVIDGSQAIQYMYRAARTGLCDVRVIGYTFER